MKKRELLSLDALRGGLTKFMKWEINASNTNCVTIPGGVDLPIKKTFQRLFKKVLDRLADLQFARFDYKEENKETNRFVILWMGFYVMVPISIENTLIKRLKKTAYRTH
jgi:hypothetical protein